MFIPSYFNQRSKQANPVQTMAASSDAIYLDQNSPVSEFMASKVLVGKNKVSLLRKPKNRILVYQSHNEIRRQ